MSRPARHPPFHRQLFRHLREISAELPGGEAVERGAEVVERRVEHSLAAVTDRIGGPARLRVVAILASVLALSAADTGAIAAVAPKLETTLGIGNVQVGLLVTVAALAAATGMLPVGWITDRMNRTRMVTAGILLWGVAEIVSALSPDYSFLLAVRVGLGVLTAVTGPTIASLTGDLFPADERSEIYGYILTGELVGAGLGLLVAGLVSAWSTWRTGIAVLSLPSFYLAWEFRRRLPEPARGGQSRLERGAEEIVAASDVEGDVATGATPHAGAAPRAAGAAEQSGQTGAAAGRTPGREEAAEETEVLRQVRRRRVNPRRGLVLDRDPLELGWWDSFRYVVAVRSNLTLILGSALGYFFFSGVETFALIYLEGHFGVGQGIATLVALAVGGAAVAGAVVGGRQTDALLRRGRLDARFVVPAAAFVVAIVVFAPGAVSATLAVSIPFFLVTGFCIGAPNPGLDAARLDVMPSRMWGRGEAVRSFLRSLLQAFAPLVFGVVSTVFGGRTAGFGPSGLGAHAAHAADRAAGLEQTFLIMLGALAAAAVVVWIGRTAYPVDVAAAAETERRFPAAGGPGSAVPGSAVPGPSARRGRAHGEGPSRR